MFLRQLYARDLHLWCIYYRSSGNELIFVASLDAISYESLHYSLMSCIIIIISIMYTIMCFIASLYSTIHYLILLLPDLFCIM